MRDVKINGKTQRVFVLAEGEDRLVYIPVKTLHRVDYTRLVDMENVSKKTKRSMLEVMKETKLDNGRNALVVYDNIIQVMIENEENKGVRIPKKNEPEAVINQRINDSDTPNSVASIREKEASVVTSEEPPKRRGRPKKSDI